MASLGSVKIPGNPDFLTDLLEVLDYLEQVQHPFAVCASVVLCAQDLLCERDPYVVVAHPSEEPEPLVSLAFGSSPEFAHNSRERRDRDAEHHNDRPFSTPNARTLCQLPAALAS